MFFKTESEWEIFAVAVVLSNHKSDEKFLEFYSKEGKELSSQNGFDQEVWHTQK